jgi:hypothetical protein
MLLSVTLTTSEAFHIFSFLARIFRFRKSYQNQIKIYFPGILKEAKSTPPSTRPLTLLTWFSHFNKHHPSPPPPILVKLCGHPSTCYFCEKCKNVEFPAE